MDELMSAMAAAKQEVGDCENNSFEAVNALAVLVAHLHEFRNEHPDLAADVDHCLRIINNIDPGESKIIQISAALIALEGRIVALTRH